MGLGVNFSSVSRTCKPGVTNNIARILYQGSPEKNPGSEGL